MPRRIIASGGGAFVSGVPVTTETLTGGALIQRLRQSGIPVRTRQPTPVQGHRTTAAPPRTTTPPVQPTRTIVGTGKELAQLLRAGGQPAFTPQPTPVQGRRTTAAPLTTRQPFAPPTIAQPSTGKEIADMLRQGGVPVRLVGEQAQANPAVAPKSQADPRAPLFNAEPAGILAHLAPKRGKVISFGGKGTTALSQEPAVPGVSFTSQQITKAEAEPFLFPTPVPVDAKPRPISVATEGGSPSLEGAPWSSALQKVAAQSSLDMFAALLEGKPVTPFIPGADTMKPLTATATGASVPAALPPVGVPLGESQIASLSEDELKARALELGPLSQEWKAYQNKYGNTPRSDFETREPGSVELTPPPPSSGVTDDIAITLPESVQPSEPIDLSTLRQHELRAVALQEGPNSEAWKLFEESGRNPFDNGPVVSKFIYVDPDVWDSAKNMQREDLHALALEKGEGSSEWWSYIKMYQEGPDGDPRRRRRVKRR